ncbi:trypsin-like cysteine/serine peptidase domain-containing protein [Chlamydoabsidia padenii]|nr:trypsin-like cysteine/serine peptidase domain-containing protein [Chlamydoabsidia padenii]
MNACMNDELHNWSIALPCITAPDALTSNQNKGTKIVGGRTADNGSYPWEVSIALTKNIASTAEARRNTPPLQKESSHHCDGVLLNSLWVLTAAHCVIDLDTFQPFNPPQKLQVGVGSHDLDALYDRGRIPVVHIEFQRGRYRPGHATSQADIALIRLAQPVPNVQPACLTGPGFRPNYPGPLTSVGFGNIHALYYNLNNNQFVAGIQPSRYLKETVVRDITQENGANPKAKYCRYRNDLICITAIIEPDSTCQGDSGGSLVFQNTVIGLTSFGDSRIKDSQTRVTCIGQTSYTRISIHLGWIHSVIGNNFCDG